MSVSIAEQDEGNVAIANENVAPSVSSLPEADDVNMEDEGEEEDEDIDFNPFLRGDSPSEASSSLSSENEGLAKNAGRSFEGLSNGNDSGFLSRQLAQAGGCENVEAQGCEDEETVMQAMCNGRNNDNPVEEITACGEVGNRDGNAGDGHLPECGDPGKPILQIDDGDAICRRTRARHSLANYTLEELETFLQESDDDGDLPNVDDEEEYRKFLAAVLANGADDRKEGQVDENVDEDEDNDADFELEIEEALESDVDENIDIESGKDGKQQGDSHMPITRRKRRLKESLKNQNTLLELAKRPLRPLMPYTSTVQSTTSSVNGWQFSSPSALSNCLQFSSGAGVITGFSAHQVGQLYCLMHEHVQLLIQVFSVSVLDPSNQVAANGTQKMISELICKREDALDRGKVPYPDFCFRHPYLCSSQHFESHEAANSSFWSPLIDSHVLSVLDVAPLRLAKNFMTDVSETAVSRYRKSHLGNVSNKSHLIKEPLFPLPALGPTSTDTPGGSTTMYSNAQPDLQYTSVQVKKSLASMIVESTKKHSVALVPKDIARLAQRFFPLFNAALFPHKPAIPGLVNRVVFTDAEDGLLAMGIMQYNNDWAAIQQHFLPCKSTHQIFVRQKNRSSSKASENPIKAVRRMKSSPLTPDEKARICEGLKIFKNDWLSVWKFILPYRDPSLLPRLWRIATGTQKSYKKSEAMKAKRRSYDAKRRRVNGSTNDSRTLSDKEVGTGEDKSAGDVEGEHEAFIHEAFLADSARINRSNSQSVNVMPYNISTCTSKSFAYIGNGREPQPEVGPAPHNSSLQTLCPPFNSSHHHSGSKASSSHLISRPCQSHKREGVRVVKLAPDLPPVNLPPSVRVISQSAFKNYQCGVPAPTFSDNNAIKDNDSGVSTSAMVRNNKSNATEHLKITSHTEVNTGGQHDVSIHMGFTAEENTSESEFQMHPLLFQAPENQLPLYFPTNIHATGSTTHSPFLRSSLQTDQTFPGFQYSASGVCSNVRQLPEKEPSDKRTIDFHPLLQRTYTESGDSATETSLYRPWGDVRVSEGHFNGFLDQSDCTLRMPVVGDNPATTSIASLSHKGTEHNLDLDICLSSAANKRKMLNRELHNTEETQNVPEHGMVGKDWHHNASILSCAGRCSEVSTSGSLSLQVIPPNTKTGCQCTGDHDDSIPGIVMEQEELSDSEEHVEFECEEIDDSEDEISTELHTEVQYKEFPFFGSKEEEVGGNRSLQSRNLRNGGAGKCHKPKRATAKRNTSCSGHLDDHSLDQASKSRSSDPSRTEPLRTTKCKTASAAATTRKPRKRSLKADTSGSMV